MYSKLLYFKTYLCILDDYYVVSLNNKKSHFETLNFISEFF